MSVFQTYLFRNVLRTLLAIVGGLALIALLTQGLQRIDLIVENHQSTLTYLWASLLSAPQIVSLLLPIALFIATAAALNTAHRENEIVVAQAAGMTNWQVASPVMRLAVIGAVLHLGLNLWIQPMASREFRETVTRASADFVASLVQEGAFTSAADGLTTFARTVNGSEMRDVMVHDSRNPEEIVTYIAKSASVVDMEGVPAISMRDGHAQQIGDNGALEALKFEQYTFDLAPFMKDQEALILKESDRFLPELFHPDLTNYYAFQNRYLLLAEGHARIAAPLLNIAMALIALYAVLGGDFSRRGYARRIALASAAAILLRLLAFGAVSAAVDEPALNIVQYLLPVGVCALIAWLHFFSPAMRRAGAAGAPPPAWRRLQQRVAAKPISQMLTFGGR
jgi:lipopolysaccharide export system permease protein